MLEEEDSNEQPYTKTNDVNLKSGTLSFDHSYIP